MTDSHSPIACREHAARLSREANDIESRARFHADQVRKQARRWRAAADEIEQFTQLSRS